MDTKRKNLISIKEHTQIYIDKINLPNVSNTSLIEFINKGECVFYFGNPFSDLISLYKHLHGNKSYYNDGWMDSFSLSSRGDIIYRMNSLLEVIVPCKLYEDAIILFRLSE